MFEVLKKYEEALGQAINLQKLDVFFFFPVEESGIQSYCRPHLEENSRLVRKAYVKSRKRGNL